MWRGAGCECGMAAFTAASSVWDGVRCGLLRDLGVLGRPGCVDEGGGEWSVMVVLSDAVEAWVWRLAVSAVRLQRWAALEE